MRTGIPFPGEKAAGAVKLAITSIYFRGQEWWSYTSITPLASMVQSFIN
jgi:hypothetical protein